MIFDFGCKVRHNSSSRQSQLLVIFGTETALKLVFWVVIIH